MPKINNGFDELVNLTRGVFSNAESTDLTADDLVANLVGRQVVLYPDLDIEAFAAKSGKRAGEVRAVLETLKGMQHPGVAMASASAQTPTAPPPYPAPSAPPLVMQPDSQPRPRPLPALLCAKSGNLPKHAMLNEKDGQLYDRDAIAKTPIARDARDDYTMTSAIHAWQEYANEPARCLANMRAAVQCAISLEVPKEPVLAADGYSYERAEIVLHLQRHGDKACSPYTNQKLAHLRLVPNRNLERIIKAYGLAESGVSQARQASDQRYFTHPRLGATQVVIEKASHRHAFDVARKGLDKLYAWAPITRFNRRATEQVADKACERLTEVLASKTSPDVHRAALQMRAEFYCLTERWPDAAADLDQLATKADLFERTRRAMMLQATHRNGEAIACMKKAAALNVQADDAKHNPEILAIMGEFLRHEHQYQLAYHFLRRSQTQGPTTAAQLSLYKTRMSMLKRGIWPKDVSEAEGDAAFTEGRDL